MNAEPRHRVDNKLMIVDTDAQDFGSGVGIVTVAMLDGGGVFGFPTVVAVAFVGPAALDNLKKCNQ